MEGSTQKSPSLNVVMAGEENRVSLPSSPKYPAPDATVLTELFLGVSKLVGNEIGNLYLYT